MVRTRDFVLLLLCVAFLLMAIVGTEVWRSWRTIPLLSSWWGGEVTEMDYTGEVPTVPNERESRLEELRGKVAERLARSRTQAEQPIVAEPLVTTTTTTTPAATSTATTSPQKLAVNTCVGYQTLIVPWNPQTVVQENREGVRMYYERGLLDPLSSSTPEIVRAIVPLRSWPLPSATCLPTDVVGIAMDGSLIRNNELALYTVFGADTLIGYSLDGFPMYGVSTLSTDACGGAMVGGTYRYTLDPKRPGIITCFAGAPARIE